VFVLCAFFGAIGLFIPSLEVEVGGMAIKKTKISLYTMSAKHELVEKMFARYHRMPGRGLGRALAGALIPKVGKRIGGVLDDAKSAAETLDDISDHDVGLGGKALVALVWIMLALYVFGGMIVFGETMREGWRGKRLFGASAIAVILAILAIGVHLVCREAVWEANDEIGAPLLAIAPGQYLMLGATLAALAAIATVDVMFLRSRRRPA
jgi:hypothetical protein